MLVLSRKVGEVITIGNSVSITILSYDRGVVRLGIDAPKNIAVHRKEIYDKIIAMNQQASKTKFSIFKDVISRANLNIKDNNILSAQTLNFKKKK